MTTQTAPTRDELLAAGVRNLREFGYPHCNEQTILTDQVYQQFFRNMLKETLAGLGAIRGARCADLMAEIDLNEAVAARKRNMVRRTRRG